MKKISIALVLVLTLGLLAGCGPAAEHAPIAATTLPVYEFTARICQGTGLVPERLVSESISCLHDYSLNVNQVRAAEAAETLVISGAGLEDFMADLLEGSDVIDASADVPLHEAAHSHHHEGEEDGHHHENDSHIWLSPANAMIMARNICVGLSQRWPDHKAAFEDNLASLLTDLAKLQEYGDTELASLSCRELITFHDGFHYFADSFGLTILRSMEEESGSEASAAELNELITLVREKNIPAVFTESNGSTSAASVIARETGAKVFNLDMAMAGDSYFDSMYHNIDTIKEALG